jgi:uncharacterized protein (DUF433 family)
MTLKEVRNQMKGRKYQKRIRKYKKDLHGYSIIENRRTEVKNLTGEV